MGGAMAMTASNIIMERCAVVNNSTDLELDSFGGAIYAMSSVFSMRNCLINNNRSKRIGGALFCIACNNATIVNCEFSNNRGSTGGAMFLSACNNITFTNNLIHHNIGEFFGGGMGLGSSNFKMINCTLVDNYGGQGGGVYCSSNVLVNAYNSIFAGNRAAGNGAQLYFAYLESTFNLTNCVAEGGKYLFGGGGGGVAFHGTYHQVIEDEILFETFGNYNYYLPENSPCIDAGEMKIAEFLDEFDIAGNGRVYNDIVDLGAFEWINTNGIEAHNLQKTEINIYPNPAKGMINISASNESYFGKYQIIDISGKVHKTFELKDVSSAVDISNIPSGIYVVGGKGFALKLVVE